MAEPTRYLRSPNFTQWLCATEEWSPYAAFARDDRCWPRRSRTLLAFVRHVREAHEDDPYAPGEREVRAMFVAFEGAIARGMRIASRASGPKMPAESRRTTQSYSLAPATEARLRRIQARTGATSRGAVIDMLAERYDTSQPASASKNAPVTATSRSSPVRIAE